MKTYLITLTLGVNARAEHLSDAHTIRAEITSWLEGLGARVDDLNIELVAYDSEEDA